MTTNFETKGGVVTRGECFSKMLHHIDELRDQILVMSHLHMTEDSNKDRLMAVGWRGIEEMLTMLRRQIVELAKGRMQ
jgi:hypothetical protein